MKGESSNGEFLDDLLHIGYYATMRKPVILLVTGLLFAILVVIGWQILPNTEPVYDGKPLGYWLQSPGPLPQHSPTDKRTSGGWGKAQEAIRHLGAKAIPVLLRMLRAHDSAFKLRLISLAQKQNVIKIEHVVPGRLNLVGSEGFKILGATGADAVPELVQIVNENLSLSSQCYAIDALGWIGPSANKAIPSLLSWLTNANASVRFNAAIALGQIHTDPEMVVPTLVKALHDPDDYVRCHAIRALSAFGHDATPAVPALVECLKDSKVRFEVPDAFRKIDPEAAAKAGVN